MAVERASAQKRFGSLESANIDLTVSTRVRFSHSAIPFVQDFWEPFVHVELLLILDTIEILSKNILLHCLSESFSAFGQSTFRPLPSLFKTCEHFTFVMEYVNPNVMSVIINEGEKIATTT